MTQSKINQPETSSFNQLSIKDLIDARDEFHVHLMNKPNVTATAIGRYLIRKIDVDKNGQYLRKSKLGTLRTLQNSAIMPFSWPCILVFVNKWEKASDIISNGSGGLIPKCVYMKDGRVIPICVVHSPLHNSLAEDVDVDQLVFPSNFIGGGFPLIINSQGVERIASVGCIVSDGHKFYALTNKHVTGESGQDIFSKFGSDTEKVGKGSAKFLGKIPFNKIYPQWESSNVLVNCDAGLVEIEDLKRWKADVMNYGVLGEVIDLNTQTLTLSIIALHEVKNEKKRTIRGKVVGYGAVSGNLEGEIAALFYRYKSIGGTEYVTDFLIQGFEDQPLNVRRGDSGMLWMLEKEKDDQKVYQPIALHWGQHEELDVVQQMRHAYSLASSLTPICHELDVDVVRSWNLGDEYSWGKIGHYTVGTFVLDAIKDTDLKKLIKANLTNISFKKDAINTDLTKKNTEVKGLSPNPDEGFCALADVPDIIWKQFKSDKAPWGRKGAENPNHYADVDAPTKAGQTMFDLCTSADQMTTAVWFDYYNNIDLKKLGITNHDPNRFGLVTFRVWQIFNYMVKALKAKRADKFIFAAGVLTHYVGDACQPLHSSFMSNGNPLDDKLVDYVAKRTSHKKNGEISHQAGDVYPKIINPGNGVHSAYEDHMVDDFIDEIKTGLGNMLQKSNSKVNKEQLAPISDGQEAAFFVLTLMKKTQETIAPVEIVEAYKKVKEKGGDISKELFQEFGERTIECLARGSRYLAAIWEAAWVLGNGADNISLIKVTEKRLITLYRKPSELPSLHLDTIDAELKRG